MRIVVECNPTPGLLINDIGVASFLADVLQEYVDANPNLTDYGIRVKVEESSGRPSPAGRRSTQKRSSLRFPQCWEARQVS
jgi:hypothetical protein